MSTVDENIWEELMIEKDLNVPNKKNKKKHLKEKKIRQLKLKIMSKKLRS